MGKPVINGEMKAQTDKEMEMHAAICAKADELRGLILKLRDTLCERAEKELVGLTDHCDVNVDWNPFPTYTLHATSKYNVSVSKE